MPWFRRQRQPDTPEFEAATRLYDDARNSYSTVLRESEKMSSLAAQHAASHFQLSQLLGGVAFTQEQPQVAAFLSAEQTVLERVDALQQQFQRLFIAPLAILLNSEFNQCDAARRHYEDCLDRFSTSRHYLDSARGRISRQPNRLADAENALYIAEQQHLHAKREFLLRLRGLEQRKRQIFEDNMRIYLEMEAETLEANITLLSQILAGQSVPNPPLLSFQRPDFQASAGLPALPPPLREGDGDGVLRRAQEQVELIDRQISSPMQSGSFPSGATTTGAYLSSELPYSQPATSVTQQLNWPRSTQASSFTLAPKLSNATMLPSSSASANVQYLSSLRPEGYILPPTAQRWS